jgi:hypothetical protein
MSSTSDCFDTRPQGDTIVFVGASSAPQCDQIPAGSTIILRCQDTQIRVAVTQCRTDQSYQGTVIGFVNHDGPDVEGIGIGQNVTFEDANIFACENLAAAA